jgi:hypothetical protein
MTAMALVTGTIFRPPEERTSKAGRPFVTALGLGLPKAAGTLVRAPFVQSYLKNQLARGVSTGSRQTQASAPAAALAGGYLPQGAQ